MIKLKNPWFFLFIILAIACVSLAFISLEQNQIQLGQQAKIAYIPDPNQISLVSLGHKESVASLFWISALVEYGGAMFNGNDFAWFSTYANISTTLDSLLYMPYYFVASIANEKDSMTIKLLDRAIRVYPNDWRLGVYYSMYLTRTYADYSKAAQVMEQYLVIDTLPDFVKRLPNSFKRRILPKNESILLLLQDYHNPSNQHFRKGLEKQMRDILSLKSATDSMQLSSILNESLQGRIQPELLFNFLISMDTKK